MPHGTQLSRSLSPLSSTLTHTGTGAFCRHFNWWKQPRGSTWLVNNPAECWVLTTTRPDQFSSCDLHSQDNWDLHRARWPPSSSITMSQTSPIGWELLIKESGWLILSSMVSMSQMHLVMGVKMNGGTATENIYTDIKINAMTLQQ